jgi:hypothetical protein
MKKAASGRRLNEGEKARAQVKVVFFIPIKDNDGRELIAEKADLEMELRESTMNEKEELERQIRELLTADLDSITFSNRLFQQGRGLFALLGQTEEQRREI